MFAIEESASIFCARLMRGIISIAMTVAPASAAAFILSSSATGEKNEISVLPLPSFFISASDGARTFAMTSAFFQSVAAVFTTSTPAAS